jgi:hypothetical protein
MDSIITLYIAKNNEALVQNLFQASIITKERVVQAMKSMDRYKLLKYHYLSIQFIYFKKK